MKYLFLPDRPRIIQGLSGKTTPQKKRGRLRGVKTPLFVLFPSQIEEIMVKTENPFERGTKGVSIIYLPKPNRM
jgi:hypothetical protein